MNNDHIPIKAQCASTLKVIPTCNRGRKLTYYIYMHSNHSPPPFFSYLSEGIRTIKLLLQHFQLIKKQGTFLYFLVPGNSFRLFALMQMIGLAYNKQDTSHVKFRKQSMLKGWAYLFNVNIAQQSAPPTLTDPLCIFKSTQAPTQSVVARFSYTSGRQGTKQNRLLDFKQNLYKLYLNILHLPTTEMSGEQTVKSLHFHLQS